jgi:hypothetical protein
MSAELIVTSIDLQEGLKLEPYGNGRLLVTAWKTVNGDSETVCVQLDVDEVAAVAAFAAAMSRKGDGT